MAFDLFGWDPSNPTDFSNVDWGQVATTASDDSTAPGTFSVTGITSADFVDYAGGNYAAKIGGSLAGAGTDLSAEFLNDITGTTR